MAFSLIPREDEYFSLFSQMTEHIKESANLLAEMMSADPSHFNEFTKKIKQSEHNCDDVMHQITRKLNKSFITPFDREDIYALSVALDDVCDYIDATARAIVMYSINDISPEAKQLARIMVDLSVQISSAVSVLSRPKEINKFYIEIHRLENEGDEVYFKAIGELFKHSTDAVQIIKWKEVYEILESATDRCESVANIIESIILKHN